MKRHNKSITKCYRKSLSKFTRKTRSWEKLGPKFDEKFYSLSVESFSSERANEVDFLTSRGYTVTGTIAEGSFARVMCAKKLRKNRDDNGNDGTNGKKIYDFLAIKIFDLSDPDRRIWVERCLKNEMFISLYLKHTNIVQTYDVFKTRNRGFIVMQLAENGSIKQDLIRRKRPYRSDEAKNVFRGVIEGLNYMHHKNVAHRDLKLENFLISAQNVPMIGDFGFSVRINVAHVELDKMARSTRCGTSGYMAPELLMISSRPVKTEGVSENDKLYYDAKAVDIFAMGVCLYEMLNLVMPFAVENGDSDPQSQQSSTTNENMNKELLNKIAKQEFDYLNHDVESSCRDLISSMLRYEPRLRPKVDQVLSHRWLKNYSIFKFIADKIF